MEFVEFTGKTVDDALANALVALETTSDNIEYEIIEKGSEGLLGIFNKKNAVIKARKKEQEAVAEIDASLTVEERVQQFLAKMFAAMNMVVEVAITFDEAEDQLNINLSGEEMGLLIGKRGQTLDSIQYIVSLMINKTEEKYIKVKVDTEEYRQRRKETLESLAKNIAFKVKRTRKEMSLEPMNPYERRIIHSTLQNDKFVTTKSEGEEPFRHVIVSLKPSANNNRYYSNPNSKYGGRSYGSRYNKYGSRYNRNEEGKEEGSEGGSRYNGRYNSRYNSRYNGYKKNYNTDNSAENKQDNSGSEE